MCKNSYECCCKDVNHSLYNMLCSVAIQGWSSIIEMKYTGVNTVLLDEMQYNQLRKSDLERELKPKV